MVKFIICICTYKREEKLKNLLCSIDNIYTPSDSLVEIIIIDNDCENLKRNIEYKSKFNIEYVIEKEKGISNARNKALDVANERKYDFLLFLDDDEFVHKSWLIELYKTYLKYNENIIRGPVITLYKESPNYIIESKFFEQERQITGTLIESCACGNVMISKDALKNNIKFSLEFNSSGGEDTDFFIKLKHLGNRIIWCDEAEVYEYLDEKRSNLKYMIKRSYVNGWNYIRIMNYHKNINLLQQTIKSIIKIIISFIGFIFFIPYKKEPAFRNFKRFFSSCGELKYIIFKGNENLY